MEALAASILDSDCPDIAWAELCQRGRDAEAKGTAALWEAGDIALEVETRYGEGRLAAYASEINVSLGTVLRRRWVSKRFAGEMFACRSEYAMLHWSHFEAVAGVRDDEQVRWYLSQAEHCDQRGRPLTVHELRKLVQGNGHLGRGRCKWLHITCKKLDEPIPLAVCQTCQEHEQ